MIRGLLNEDRVERFKDLLEFSENHKHKNQYK